MAIINSGIRKGIKVMAYTCQRLQFFALMPKPQDFITRIVGDVVYLSARLTKLSEDMNRLLDSYTDIPTNYLMTQMNSLTGSLTGITNRLNIYGQNAVNQTFGLAENATNIITELTGSAIDTTGELTTAIINLGSAMAQTPAYVLGQTDMAEDVYDATEVIVEWTKDGFKVVKDSATDPVKKVTQNLVNTRNGINQNIQEVSNTVNGKIEDSRKWVENLIMELREKMRQLTEMLDTGFKDVTGLTSVSKGATVIGEELTKINDTKEAKATSAVAMSISNVIKNFSIGKMVTAFVGVLTQSVIVRLGLNQLPPIDFESMLCKVRDDLTISTKDLYEHYSKVSDSAYRDIIDFGKDENKMRGNDVYYGSENYHKFMKEFDEDLKKRRDEIRTLMKTSQSPHPQPFDPEKNREIKSAIDEIDKFRKKIRAARTAGDLKSKLGIELDNFKKEAEYRCNSIKADWQSMMKQYSDALAEIKEFFTTGGSGDMFIDDCCDRINKDFDEIKALCKNLGTQLVSSTIKVIIPSDIGTVVPNPVYKIADFIMDIKTILKFLKDLITLIIDIINHINKLARIMLNGMNSLADIIKQLMDIVGLKWLMNLIQSIISLFGENIMYAKDRLENTLSPVHFSDTEEYNNAIEALEELMEGEGKHTMTSKCSEALADVQNLLSDYAGHYVFKNKEANSFESIVKDINSIKNKKSFSGDDDAEKIDDLADELEEKGETIVAYKAPILKEVDREHEPKVSDMVNGDDITTEIKFIGWRFFHPALDRTSDTYYGTKGMKRVKSKIIKKASKTGHKKNGGIYWMKNRKKVKQTYAYDAFYWYTYYTEDMEKDCFEWGTDDNAIIIDNIVQTENGSVVELSDGRKVFVADNMVRKGDYVNVDGVKYRVK
jgi:hypothetical protein